VRTAGTKPRLALGYHRRLTRFKLLRFNDRKTRCNPRSNMIRERAFASRAAIAFAISAGDSSERAGNSHSRAAPTIRRLHCRVRQIFRTPSDARHHASCKALLLTHTRGLTFFLNDQNFFQSCGESPRVLRVKRPDATNLEQTNADFSASLVVQSNRRGPAVRRDKLCRRS